MVPAGTVSAPAITTSGDTNTGIFFPAADTIAFAEGGAEAMRIDSSGNVGIGTSSPRGRLDLGTVSSTTLSNNLANAQLILEAPAGTGNFCNNIVWSETTGSAVAVASISTVDEGASSATGMVFATGNNTAIAERMRIDSSGILLLGRTTASGNDNTAGCNIEPSGLFVAQRNAGATLILNRFGSDGTLAEFRRQGTTRGSISITTTATAYNTSSDYRLKEDWQPILGAITRLNQLKPVNFAWKVDGSRVDGFLAHEAQDVVPEAVTGTKDAVDAEGKPEYQGIDQSKLVPLLTAALQEAVAEINSLKARLDAANL